MSFSYLTCNEPSLEKPWVLPLIWFLSLNSSAAIRLRVLSKRFLEERVRVGIPGFMTWGIVYEFLRVSTHRKVFPKPLSLKKSISFIDTLFETGVISVLVEQENHRETLMRISSEVSSLEGNLLHDVHTAALMREHGIERIYTHDSDFLRFKFLEVVNPWEPRSN